MLYLCIVIQKHFADRALPPVLCLIAQRLTETQQQPKPLMPYDRVRFKEKQQQEKNLETAYIFCSYKKSSQRIILYYV